jgi:hypothetical protein
MADAAGNDELNLAGRGELKICDAHNLQVDEAIDERYPGSDRAMGAAVEAGNRFVSSGALSWSCSM